MFRMILNVEDVDYNTLIDMISDMIKQNKDNPALKGMKMPIGGFSMLKHLPTDKKNEMFAMVINQDKNRTIQTLASVVSANIGAIRVLDASATTMQNGIQLLVDVGAFDFDKGIDLFFPKYLQEEDFNEAVGDEVTCPNIDDFCRQVKMLPIEDKEVVFLRSIRMKKDVFLLDLENVMKGKGISLRLTELKILVRR